MRDPSLSIPTDMPRRGRQMASARRRAVHRLGQDVVRAAEWVLGELEALVLEHVMRGAAGDSAIEQGWLLRELVQRFGLGLDKLGRRFDRSSSWVSRRLGLVTDLPALVQEQVRADAIGARALGVSRGSVKRVLEASSAEVPRMARAERAEPHREQIVELYTTMKGNLEVSPLVACFASFLRGLFSSSLAKVDQDRADPPRSSCRCSFPLPRGDHDQDSHDR